MKTVTIKVTTHLLLRHHHFLRSSKYLRLQPVLTFQIHTMVTCLRIQTSHRVLAVHHPVRALNQWPLGQVPILTRVAHFCNRKPCPHILVDCQVQT